MAFLRWDRLHEDWVIEAPERSARPNDYVGDDRRHPPRCPFCPGHEADTPPPLLTVPPVPGTEAGWSVRCVPNRYPAVAEAAVAAGPAGPPPGEQPAIGRHEIVIESPWHESRFDDLPADHAVAVVGVIHERMAVLRETGAACVLAFKNHGARAGASLRHGHTQVIALPFVPSLFERELRAFDRHAEPAEACLLCDSIEIERRHGDRQIAERDGFMILAPYASRFGFELLITPTTHDAVFEESPRSRLVKLAGVLQLALSLLRERAGDPPFNLVVHSAPPAAAEATGRGARGPGPFHWHIEILPRIGALAGFEWGTGGAINSMRPERAAAILRGEVELGERF